MMGDYEALNQRLWQLVAEHDRELTDGAKITVALLIGKLRAEGFQIGPETSTALAAHFDAVEHSLRTGIQAATRLGSPAPMRDETVARLTQAAFTRTWDDGKNLSTRLWQFRQDTTTGLGKILADGARMGRAVGGLVYDLQRRIEAKGTRFEIVHTALDDWMLDLAGTGKALIKDKVGRATWNKALGEAEARIAGLARTGTRHAAEVAVGKIKAAVEAGQAKLLEDALYWWNYDKQLYYLKRISRSELATAQHRGVIDSTVEDEDIIGYQWRLGGSHPHADICDFYASVDMGLGRGVFTKRAVPPNKPHPHCMCLLIPRVTKIKRAGSHDYAEFLDGLPLAQRQQILPAWAQTAHARGIDYRDLMLPDGMGLISREQAVARFGAGRIGTP